MLNKIDQEIDYKASKGLDPILDNGDSPPATQRQQRRRLTGGIATGIEQIQLPRLKSIRNTNDSDDEDDDYFPHRSRPPAGRKSIRDPWNATSLMPPDRTRRRNAIPSLSESQSNLAKEISSSSMLVSSYSQYSHHKTGNENDDDVFPDLATTSTVTTEDTSQPFVLCEGLVWIRILNSVFSYSKFTRRYFVLQSDGTLLICKDGNQETKVEKTTTIKSVYASSYADGQYKGLTFCDDCGKEKDCAVLSNASRAKWLEAGSRIERSLTRQASF